MTLSQHEQRALAGIERDLAAQAPRLAALLSGVDSRPARLRWRIAVLRLLWAVVGVGIYIAGLQVHNDYGTAVCAVGYVAIAALIITSLPRI
jgi:hypothetical protein